MCCCRDCARALLAIVSGVVAVIATVICVFSTWLLVVEELYLENAGWKHTPALATLATLVAGLSLALVSFLGCCGAITSSRCGLGMFLICLGLLTAGQIVLGVLLYFKEIDYVPLLRAGVRQTVQEKYHGNNSATVMYWDRLQQGLECCGSTGPMDWSLSVYNGYHLYTKEIGIGPGSSLALPFTIPSSCCRNTKDPLCSGTLLPSLRPSLDPSIYFTEGCLSKLSSLVQDNLILLACAGLGVLLVECVGVFLGCCLCCSTPSNKRHLHSSSENTSL